MYTCIVSDYVHTRENTYGGRRSRARSRTRPGPSSAQYLPRPARVYVFIHVCIRIYAHIHTCLYTRIEASMSVVTYIYR